jgi:hypothetical protein
MEFVLSLAVIYLYFATGVFFASIVYDDPTEVHPAMVVFWPVILVAAITFVIVLIIPIKLSTWFKNRFDI